MKALKLNPTLTLADAKRQVKAMGLTLVRKADTDEYVVKSPDGGTYHTDDLADAVGTARDLSGRPAVMGGKSSHRNPHNVERSGFHRGEHVAYGTNREGAHDVWRVRKMGNRYEATARATGERLSGRTLKEVGAAIEAQSPRFDEGKVPQRNPPKPGTYAGGVGFWRKSIGLAEGTPKHLGPRPKHTTDVDYVEYVRPLAGEPVFELGGNRYQYVVGRYPSGREDIAVYSFAGDVTHGYAFFRRMLNLT